MNEKMSETKWITFDCYGTLVDWNGGFRAILERVAGERVDELVAAYHRFERIVESETPHRSYRKVLATTLQRAANSCGISLAQEQQQIIAESWGRLGLFLTSKLNWRDCGLPPSNSVYLPTAMTISSGLRISNSTEGLIVSSRLSRRRITNLR